MFATLQHECTRVPVTALSSCGPFLVAAEGPFLRFYTRQDHIYLSSKRVFQAQAIHGISVLPSSDQNVNLVVWGGLLVRAFELPVPADAKENSLLNALRFSNVAKAPDWILDLSPRTVDQYDGANDEVGVCAAVTAHNALLELTVTRSNSSQDTTQSGPLVVSIAELTSSSRSILYSAHVLWESSDHLLVAAGTAFGEIMYWSWARTREEESTSHVHRVFLGHEGSIFGVRISNELELIPGQGRKRLLASCSDDRTIRVWDISNLQFSDEILAEAEDHEKKRTRHTGFSNASFDADLSSTDCLAIGWGHSSRVWTIQFLDHTDPSGGITLLSSGEDATSRTWNLVPNSDRDPEAVGLLPYKLLQLDSASSHNGKNMWSLTVHEDSSGLHQVTTGGADSQITTHSLNLSDSSLSNGESFTSQFTVHDIAPSTEATTDTTPPSHPISLHKSSKKAEFFRSYTFIDENTFLLTTNSGKVYLQSGPTESQQYENSATRQSIFVDQIEDLTGYSVCTGVTALGAAFIAGSRGSVYYYHREAKCLTKIHTVNGKVGELFVANYGPPAAQKLVLLVSLVGQSVAQLLHLDLAEVCTPTILSSVTVPMFEESTGFAITSMDYVPTTSQYSHLLLGFRKGSIAIYRIPSAEETAETLSASLAQIVETVHEREAVTSIVWVPVKSPSQAGNIISTGRDGRLAIHASDLTTNTIHLVHSLTLPIGPNIEGVYINEGHLFVYGFASKRFVFYDTSTEEELMSVDTGGAHRSWTFQPSSRKLGGGTLVWTRASSMHVCRQAGPNHQVLRSGGHGREIKAVTISKPAAGHPQKQLIATGAEDTDIKIFEYVGGEIVYRRTLRKHTTGIQHLQWSDDGVYLFSSGGCEELYIWRVCALPHELGDIGVVCESVYQPESEHSDLRIMSFDVWRRDPGFVIAVVFSNSDFKVYSYDPTSTTKWCPLAKGIYSTSCLTQCVFLSPTTILTAGTDGHVVLWPLNASVQQQPLDFPPSAQTLIWKKAFPIHQSSSKTLTIQSLDKETTLMASGGDDGSLAFCVTPTRYPFANSVPPVILTRAHASAVTACAMLSHRSRIFVLTSGNDQWVRLWEVVLRLDTIAQRTIESETKSASDGDPLSITRVGRIKTNVADVSSMAVLAQEDEGVAKVLICGVGMEVIRVDWKDV